ncbi:MAG: SRPBCC domain-containing protein [Sphingobacteriales bacterium]|nr:MAG: SRPBCC domain-containing protein [Sphingobacteriales bacterium]
MERLKFDITINALREKVWQTLWDDATYRQWTEPFHPGSHMVSDMQEGSKVLFLGPDKSGMVSRIAKKVDNEYMAFEHLGEVIGGVEDTTSEKVKQWAGSIEDYKLTDNNGKTDLHVEVDGGDGEMAEMFKNMWPKALSKLKEISETN